LKKNPKFHLESKNTVLLKRLGRTDSPDKEIDKNEDKVRL